MAKKSQSSSPRKATASATRKTTAAKSPVASRRKATASEASSAPRAAKKHVGDVLGISRARVSKSVPGGGGRPKGIELAPGRRTGMKPARVVGGVRGRGR